MKLEYKTLKEKMKEFNKKEAKFYGNMFAKLTKSDSPDSKASILLVRDWLQLNFVWLKKLVGSGFNCLVLTGGLFFRFCRKQWIKMLNP